MLRMISKNRYEPGGESAVHCVRKEQYKTQMLICANSLATATEAGIDISAERTTFWQEYFTSKSYPVVDGTILARFKPFEVKVLLESR